MRLGVIQRAALVLTAATAIPPAIWVCQNAGPYRLQTIAHAALWGDADPWNSLPPTAIDWSSKAAVIFLAITIFYPVAKKVVSRAWLWILAGGKD